MLERIRSVAYRLQLPGTSQIHPIIHVALLNKAIGDYQMEHDLPPLDWLEPNAVLATRSITRRGKDMTQFLIPWKVKSVYMGKMSSPLEVNSLILALRTRL